MSIADYQRARNIPEHTNESNKFIKEPDIRHVECVDITEKHRGQGDQPLIVLTSSYLQAKDSLGKYDDYALLLRRKVDKEGDETSTTLEVRDPRIRDALKSVLSTYSYLNLEARPIQIRKPYDALFHYRDELREYAKAPERSVEDKRHMDVLIDFMHKHLAATERLYLQLVPNGMIDFDNLWTLFRAEDVIVQQTDYYRQCYRVISCGNIVGALAHAAAYRASLIRLSGFSFRSFITWIGAS